MRFAAIDFETTGPADGWPDEPWQLGIAEIDCGTAVPESLWETFFHIPAARPFSPRAPGRWAQIRGELAAAPGWNDQWEDVCGRLSGVPLAAHNAATERRILAKRAPFAPLGPWIDTLRLSKRLWPGMASYALGDVIDAFSLGSAVDALCPGRTWHDALYDAAACAVLLAHIIGTVEGIDCETLCRNS